MSAGWAVNYAMGSLLQYIITVVVPLTSIQLCIVIMYRDGRPRSIGSVPLDRSIGRSYGRTATSTRAITGGNQFTVA